MDKDETRSPLARPKDPFVHDEVRPPEAEGHTQAPAASQPSRLRGPLSVMVSTGAWPRGGTEPEGRPPMCCRSDTAGARGAPGTLALQKKRKKENGTGPPRIGLP